MKPFYTLIGIALVAFLSFFVFPFWDAMQIALIAFVLSFVILFIAATCEVVTTCKEICELDNRIRELEKKK